MNSLFFFDDWQLHAREGLDRKLGRPQPVKEIDLGKHPDVAYIAAYHAISSPHSGEETRKTL